MYTSAFMCTCVYVCMVACYSDTSPLARSGPDTMVIRRPIHGMIRRSVPVRAVKTRGRFNSKTVSFHVSVLYLFIEYFGIISRECF